MWYIKLCFNRELITEAIIHPNNMPKMLEDLIFFLFLYDNLLVLLSLNLRLTLDIILLLFSENIYDIIIKIHD